MLGNPTIRDIAVSNARNLSRSKERTSKEDALFFIGDKNVGKTSLIFRLLDRNEAPKPTLALEYVYFRISGKSLTKDVFHVWELGGGLSSVSLISVIEHLHVDSLTVVLMLDLSSLNCLWNTLESSIHAVKTSVLKNQNLYKNQKFESEKENGQDLFPVPLIIMGGKYDKFQEFEPQKKRIVCQCLRFVAHFYGASLIFYSSNDASLVKKIKEFLTNPRPNSSSQAASLDHNKPIFIIAGTDSFQNIDRITDAQSISSIDKCKHVFTTHFEQESSLAASLPDDPVLDSNFKEPAVDSLRRRKDEELELIRLERKGGLNIRKK